MVTTDELCRDVISKSDMDVSSAASGDWMRTIIGVCERACRFSRSFRNKERENVDRAAA